MIRSRKKNQAEKTPIEIPIPMPNPQASADFISREEFVILIMKFKVVLEEAEDGGYVVYVPALPGCVSQGETKEDARENIKKNI